MTKLRIIWENIHDTFRYNLPNFFKNLWQFRKELYTFRTWDYTYNLAIFRRSLELTKENIRLNGFEENVSRLKKVARMEEAIAIIKHIETEQPDYIDLAEEKLGFKYQWFVPKDDEARANNTKLRKKAQEIEDEEWNRLWSIFKGKEHEVQMSNENWDKEYDGSNLKRWWD